MKWKLGLYRVHIMQDRLGNDSPSLLYHSPLRSLSESTAQAQENGSCREAGGSHVTYSLNSLHLP